MLARSISKAAFSPSRYLHRHPNAIRMFSHTPRNARQLKIGYIPEHFSTPLHFAQTHFSLDAHLIPFPTGTGALTAALKKPQNASSDDGDEGAIDVAIGLTEGFVADMGKTKSAGQQRGYGLVGTYVESPLCWGISTGAAKGGLGSVEELRRTRVGVSRVGSGSYVMAHVLADQQGWLSQSSDKPFSDIVPIGDFAALRRAVNDGDTADFFMWEHFTTKHYWDNGELKRVGEIYTPWPSWMIAARDPTDSALEDMAQKINQGVVWYREHAEEAVEHICGTMKYSKEDAREWMKTVRFADDVRGVDVGVVEKTMGILKKAGVLGEEAGEAGEMIDIKRAEKGRES